MSVRGPTPLPQKGLLIRTLGEQMGAGRNWPTIPKTSSEGLLGRWTAYDALYAISQSDLALQIIRLKEAVRLRMRARGSRGHLKGPVGDFIRDPAPVLCWN